MDKAEQSPTPIITFQRAVHSAVRKVALEALIKWLHKQGLLTAEQEAKMRQENPV